MSCKLDDRGSFLPEREISLTIKSIPTIAVTSKAIAIPDASSQQPESRPRAKRERTSSSYIGGYWEPDEAEIHALTMADFQIMGVLGVGTYGVVKLARHIRSSASVALKVLSKEHVVSMRQEKHILRERMVHIKLHHPFIARLFGTFQDDDCLYLVIEYLPGGELWGLVYSEYEEDDSEYDDGASTPTGSSSPTFSMSPVMIRPIRTPPASPALSPDSPNGMRLDARSRCLLRNKFGGLHDEHAAFYLGCILSAFEYLHGQDMLYRDLKLENLVLDRKGYPKVLDFGFAKPNAANSAKNMTLCGSMDYMAPEIVLHEPHDLRADIWSFGIIMYEMLLGKTPFYHENPRELGRKITSEPVKFPNDFEEEYPLACDLINRLLVKTPNDRVRSMEEIKNHAFFAELFPAKASWERLLRKEITAPFVPKLSGPFDTSFFQTVDDCEQEDLDDSVQPYYEDGSNIFKEF
ncbi:hypothetical protein Poli38472_001910 [Pythium oligandrum]|uniref:Uncharacterized protein n=1 Tax=Pythium oligandrum TaxID=41045 RepID=A0A8K1CV07_PYTOL|nr:hypothetical protein Poli38472_001910 [Pythium oligandrum]|eukprot:TMW69754.1 hypothetical protein Poli38472_001910 [Pythium oligandrum]